MSWWNTRKVGRPAGSSRQSEWEFRPGDDAPSRAWAFWYCAAANTPEERRERERFVKSFLEAVTPAAERNPAQVREAMRELPPDDAWAAHARAYAAGRVPVGPDGAVGDIFDLDPSELKRGDEMDEKLAKEQLAREWRENIRNGAVQHS